MTAPTSPSASAAIKLLVLDVDGVLTDGAIIVDDHGVESKHFHVRDGAAIALWHKLGNRTAILSGRSARCVDLRAAELGSPRSSRGRATRGRLAGDAAPTSSSRRRGGVHGRRPRRPPRARTGRILGLPGRRRPRGRGGVDLVTRPRAVAARSARWSRRSSRRRGLAAVPVRHRIRVIGFVTSVARDGKFCWSNRQIRSKRPVSGSDRGAMRRHSRSGLSPWDGRVMVGRRPFWIPDATVIKKAALILFTFSALVGAHLAYVQGFAMLAATGGHGTARTVLETRVGVARIRSKQLALDNFGPGTGRPRTSSSRTTISRAAATCMRRNTT